MKKTANEDLPRLSPEAFKIAEKQPVALVLDNVRSLHNVGSAFRTGDAFLIQILILCGITGQPPNREIHKTALGATETVDWRYEVDTLSALKRLKTEGFELVAVEQTEESLSLTDFLPQKDKKYAFVFGNEVFGVSEEALTLCDQALEIPQFGSKHSLNVSVSIGVVLWDYFIKSRV